MSITVQAIIDLPIFHAAKVVTGHEFLESRKVSWMSTLEGPVEDFVYENDFILTSGIGFKNDSIALLNFVHDVYRAGASALGIAIGRYVPKIDQKIIEFAKSHNFIIIELPWDTRFADLQRETMSRINQQKDEQLQSMKDIQKQLIDQVIQGRSLIEIFRYFEQKMDAILIYADNKGRLKSASIKPEVMIEQWEKLIETAKYMPSTVHHLQKIIDGDDIYLKKQIQSTTTSALTEGYFIIKLSAENFSETELINALESLSAATALWISREHAIVTTEVRLRNEFIWGITNNDLQSQDPDVQSRSKLFGYNLDLPYLCAVGYSTNFDSLTKGRYKDEDSGFKSIIYYIEEEVRYAGSMVNRQVAFTFHTDRLIIFLEAQKEEQGTIHHFLDLVDKRLNLLIPGVVFTWGMGMHNEGIHQFHESYKKADSSLDLALTQKDPGGRVNFEDTQLNRLLLHLANNEEVREITRATIAPLIDYERERHMDLIDTFIAYDNQTGNVSQAARVLNLHRQSLLYRLRKIESLTNLSLDNPDDAFLLNISIKVWLTGAFQVDENKE